MFSVVPFLNSIFYKQLSFRFSGSSDQVNERKDGYFLRSFYSFVFGGSEFHEMNNQNRQVPLDDYSPHEALSRACLSTSVLIIALPVIICHLPPICKESFFKKKGSTEPFTYSFLKSIL